MNTLHVERLFADKQPTLGLLRYAGSTAAFTLEDRPRRVKLPGDTCIPAGTYPLRWRTVGKWAQRFQAKGYPGSLEICDVPEFTAVLLHYGNTKRDTAGCLLAGMVGDMQDRIIGNSRLAVDTVYVLVHTLPGDWQIRYTDPVGP